MSQKRTKQKRKAAQAAPAKTPKEPTMPKTVDLEKCVYIIPGPLAQRLVDYLQARPFGEVYTLVNELMRCQRKPKE